MSDKKEAKSETFWNRKITKFLFSIFASLSQKFSIQLLSNAREQINELIGQIKRGILAGFLAVFGLLFFLIGIAIYIESFWDFIPGGGYLIVGGMSILAASLIIFSKK